MLTIRLSRHGRIKRPFYRVVLTEHTKPAKSGYKTVLGSYDPLKYLFEADIPAIRTLIGQGAQPSERVAKLLFKATNDVFYKGFYKEIERTWVTKKEKKN